MTQATPPPETDSTRQTQVSLTVTSPADIKDSVHHLLWQHLPEYVQQAGGFEDCRIEFYRDYRILFITSDGLGVDMDHHGEDINYFQCEAMDIVYSSDAVEYIDRGKAKRYETFGQVSLFTTVWPDIVEALGNLQPGPGILQP
jgi:hypothetical protein